MNYDTDVEIHVEEETLPHEGSLSYKHPSFGMVKVSRTQGGPADPLFGAEIDCNTHMSLTISYAKVNQDLGRNWYYSYQDVCECIMTPVQYSELISTPNTTGVPCTIRYTQKDGTIKYRPISTKTIYIKSKIEKEIEELKLKASKVESSVNDILSKKGSFNKSDKDEIQSLVSQLSGLLNSRIPFYEKCLKENIERQLMEAKTEVESYVTHAIHQTGLKALQDPEILKLVFKDNKQESDN